MLFQLCIVACTVPSFTDKQHNTMPPSSTQSQEKVSAPAHTRFDHLCSHCFRNGIHLQQKALSIPRGQDLPLRQLKDPLSFLFLTWIVTDCSQPFTAIEDPLQAGHIDISYFFGVLYPPHICGRETPLPSLPYSQVMSLTAIIHPLQHSRIQPTTVRRSQTYGYLSYTPPA